MDPRLVEWILLPPTGPLAMAAVGLLLSYRIAGRVLVGFALLLLYASAIPATSQWLADRLQNRYSVVTGDEIHETDPQAIVVLGAGVDQEPREYESAVPNRFGLERLHYTAELHRRTGLPVATSGGPIAFRAPPGARLMAQTLKNYLDTPVRWMETRSSNTWENARNTAKLLRRDGIERALLVTHATHMPRAMMSFERTGLTAIPAPMGFIRRDERERGLWAYLPRAASVLTTQLALHEMVGLVWYRWHYL